MDRGPVSEEGGWCPHPVQKHAHVYLRLCLLLEEKQSLNYFWGTRLLLEANIYRYLLTEKWKLPCTFVCSLYPHTLPPSTAHSNQLGQSKRSRERDGAIVRVLGTRNYLWYPRRYQTEGSRQIALLREPSRRLTLSLSRGIRKGVLGISASRHHRTVIGDR